MIAPRDKIAGRVHAGFQIVIASGAVEIMAHIVFAGPQQLHGRAGYFRDPCAFDHVIIREAPAKAAAHPREMDGDVAFLDAQRFGDLSQAPLRSLTRDPHFEFAVAVMCRAVLRLERRMRDKRIVVSRLDDLCGILECGLGVAVLAQRTRRWLLGKLVRATREPFTALA